MSNPFEELGNSVAAAWAKSECHDEAFAGIATSLVAESNILHQVDADGVIEWLFKSDKVPQQDDHEFGQPPIVVYEGKGFFIQVLFWIDSTTAIHEHGFSGAFGVLSGSSVHSRYEFEPEGSEATNLRVGKTKFLYSELLGHGDVREIQKGNGFAHSLFHLDRPSVSVVVRTHKAEQQTPQYSYLKPYLAIDPFYTPGKLENIQIRMLESLDVIDRKSFWRHAGELSLHCDPWMLFKVVSIAYRHVGDTEWRDFIDHVSGRDPLLLRRMICCMEEMSRETKIISLRNTVHDPVHRFFMGLLLNVPNRQVLYHLILQRFPHSDPESLVLCWLAEIFDDPSKGIKLTPISTLLLQLALHHPDFEHAIPSLADRFQLERDPGSIPGIRKLWNALQTVDVLAPLFATENAETGVQAA